MSTVRKAKPDTIRLEPASVPADSLADLGSVLGSTERALKRLGIPRRKGA